MARVLVTGGGGFVGKALGRFLIAKNFEVISVARGKYPELIEAGIAHHQLDLTRDVFELETLTEGCDAVFHVAAKVDMWGCYQDFFSANVIATRNIISACRKSRVGKLIFTSSPSVIADGRDLIGVNESYPYPQKYMAYYPQTKAQAEREVLTSNSEELRTIALRPHLIWGKGDTNLIPTILEKASRGKLVCIGSGKNLTDLTYIDDCVEAHYQAYQALDTNPSAAGRAYFISQNDPVKMWEWINEILQIHSLSPVSRKISKTIAMVAASLLETISSIVPGSPEPLFTRFLVCEMSTSHYFDINAARRELGYNPKFSVKEAMRDCFTQDA